MADEEINYESDAGLDSIFFTRPKGPNPPPTPYLYVANCGAEAEMTYAALADVFSSFGHVRRVVPAGAANLTRIFVVFGGRSRAEASAAAEAALQALSGKPCADAGGRKMHIQFAVGKRSAPVEHPVVHHNVDALAIPGLFLHLDFVTPEMEQSLLEFADGNDWHYLTKRRVQHHGYAFNYSTRDIEKDKWIGPLPAAVSDFVSRAEQLPELTGCPEVCMPLDQLTEGRGGPGEENAAPSTSPLLPFFSLSPYATDQRINESATGVGLAPHIDTHAAFEGAALTLSQAGPAISGINEYGTGVGLAPHIDTHAAFEGAVLSLSLAGPAIMEFRRPLGPQPVGKQPLGKKKVVGGSSGSSEQGVGIERDFVHKVYDAIAPHFSATRFARWPKVAEFLLSLPPGSLVLDAGCGNGKYLNGGLPIPPALPSAASVSVSASSSLSMRTSSSPFPSSSSTPSSSTPFPPSSSPSSAPTRPPAGGEEGGRVLVTVWAREQENPGLLDKWTPLIGRMADKWVGDVEAGGGEEKGGGEGREGGEEDWGGSRRKERPVTRRMRVQGGAQLEKRFQEKREQQQGKG
ncbi:unnamed protein product [Closterium sp. NIES-64]|nr:unnamed protein product [Closterium sp. NIES-64]